MKKRTKKRFLTFATAILAGLLMSHGLVQLANDAFLATSSFAESANVVSLAQTSVSVDSSNIVYVDINVSGTPNATVGVTYRTQSGTAIENVDYQGLYSSIDIKLDVSGNGSHKVAIKCLNDSSNREKLRVSSAGVEYGRYFNFLLLSASNGSIHSEKKSCKCFLSYDYRVEATVGLKDGAREIAYINDYAQMESRYHKGENDISGKETWKTWKEGVSFNGDVTKRWVNTFVNTGLASAYTSHIYKSIDDDKLHSTTNIHMLAGNKEFMDKYSRDTSCPGLNLYYQVEPCKKGGYRLDGTGMYYISRKQNPHDKYENEAVDVVDFDYVPTTGKRRIYWIQKNEAWYSSANSIYDTVFYKIEPYNGVLDYGLAIYNGNKSWDREVHNIWLFMALVDETEPVLERKYCEYDATRDTLRFYLRFNEPVYSSKSNNSSLTLKMNGYGTKYYADYVEGNYSDTLVYEYANAAALNRQINQIQFELPNSDIGDMAYNLDAYKIVRNNLLSNTSEALSAELSGTSIDLSHPQIAFTRDYSPSIPRAVHNVMISANGNGSTSFNSGTVYYSWVKDGHVSDINDPSSYDYSHVLTSDEMGSFSVTLAKSSGFESGNYNLDVLAVSPYGITATNSDGPYHLDGEAPAINFVTPTGSDNTLLRKNYKVQVTNKESGASLSEISATIKTTDSEGNEITNTYPLCSGGTIASEYSGVLRLDSTSTSGMTVVEYRSNIDESDTSIALDPLITNLMGERARLSIEISFTIGDSAGNSAKTESFATSYDKRTLFEHAIDVPSSYHEISDPNNGVTTPVYDISGASSSDGITFTLTGSDEIKDVKDDGATYSIQINGEEKGELDTSGAAPFVTVKGLEAGYYEAVGTISGGSNNANKVSQSFSFYLTEGKNDDTANKKKANGDLVLTNKIYQLSDARFYYFRSSDSTVQSFAYGASLDEGTTKYSGGSTTPAFSSSVEAKKYVKFMEYQDLDLISINQTIASSLNNSTGQTAYVKAAKETRSAIAGQLWIRYKRASWTSSTGANGWAFYYYGEGNVENGINVSSLSSNLNAAIDEVTNRIISSGSERFLVGEEGTNPYTHAPYLPTSDTHVGEEIATSTMNGATFVSNLVYRGDSALHVNTVNIDSTAYPLASNLALEVTTSTMLYYHAQGVNEWTKLDVSDGQTLKSALQNSPSGLYTIREYGPSGVGEFTVYVDQSLPILNVIVNSGLENENAMSLDGTITRITGKTLTFVGFEGEADPLSYVAIYSFSGRKLQTVLYGSELNGYILSDGNYYLEVGDRSGNVVTYTVWTSESKIDWSVEENESGTAVIVKVNNREESEIYLYEVYINEVLVDTEFAAQKTYRQAGYFRVVIADIYNADSPETKTLTHESPAPDMTWYYLNDNGGYSTYDETRPVKMVLETDETASRTTNVLSSTMVRVKFNDVDSKDVSFELTGVEAGEYTYNEVTGLLSINTLSGWSLRVWYSNEPENDHIFLFRVDADAPEVSANFLGEGFRYNVVTEDDPLDEENTIIVTTSTFDMINTSLYSLGDTVHLDTLAYETLGQYAQSFQNGAVFSGSHIVLQLSDASGLKKDSLSVTRNGVAVNVELSDNDELVLNGYGAYVVTVSDNLGNVTRFSFTNVEGGLSSAYVDGSLINEDELTYGHEALLIDTSFDGENTILIKKGDKVWTYEFHYENGVFTYGTYVLAEDSEEGSSERYAEYVESSFRIDRSELNRYGLWNSVIENEDFLIEVMIDDAGYAHYRLSSLGEEILVESRFESGSIHRPERYVAALSLSIPELVLMAGDNVAEKIESLDQIYINGTLTIDETKVDSSIDYIEYKYCQDGDFDSTGIEPTVLMENGEWKSHLEGKELGYYQILVTNKYGNKTIYLIRSIESFASEVVIHTLDGASVTYTNSDETIYSNYAIDLIVFSTEVEFEVNGVSTSGKNSGESTIYTIDREGTYTVSVIGANGIRQDFSFVIDSDDDFVFSDSWISGINQEAILASEGYTNTLCSIELDEEIVFVDVVINDDRYEVLYDVITGTGYTDPENLKQAIGRYGVGKYVIGFRNKYGDLLKKTIHYNNIPSIRLTRTIASDPLSEQEYDLGLAIRKGFYSNNVLYFSTDSTAYYFTINEVEYRLDEKKSLEFSNSSGNGSFSYMVTYRDEYGNYVEFYAILSRQEVSFDTSAMSITTINDVLYTRDDVKITFHEDLKATVSVDGEEAEDYLSGTTRYADGTYRFVVRDIAGNNAVFEIVHKSMNHYSLTVASTGEEVIDGGVINDSRVTFSASDGSYIKYVVRNGELVSEITSSTFSYTGHYELLIEDMIGNQSYEEFTILNNSLATFSYSAPYDYEVTEVWRVDSDGERELLSLKGKNIVLNENGDYLVVVTSTKTTSYFNFTVSIDNTAPSAKLVGVEDGGVTAKDVTFTGLRVGDVIRIYRDGVLIGEETITTSTSAPTISTGGKYRVVITNVQGVTLEYNFTRKAITNVPGSIFIIVFSALLVAAVGIGLTYRTKLKTDD